MAAFQMEFTNERILPTAGLSLVGAILENSGFTNRINSLDITNKRKGHHIKNGDLLTIFIALCAQGKPQFEAVNEMKDDPDFSSSHSMFPKSLLRRSCASAWMRSEAQRERCFSRKMYVC